MKSVHGLAHNDFVRDNLGRVRAPTLIVFGEMDRLIPNPFMHGGFTSSVMRQGQQRIPNAKLVALPRCGHMVQMDCADRFNEEVLTYLATHAPR